ncbi:hypothetical protein Tco_0432141 [Tanacetum coccineum]
MDHLSTVDGKLMMGFLENTPNVKGNGPDWLFDVDSLSISMNYVPICLAEIKLMVFCKTIDRHYHKVSEEDAEEKPTEMDKSRASDKDGEDDQATRNVGARQDLYNLEITMNVSPIPTIRIDKDHPKDQIIRDLNSVIQTRRMTKISDEHAMVSYINKQRRTNHKDYQNCLFACFLSQNESNKVIQALEDPS